MRLPWLGKSVGLCGVGQGTREQLAGLPTAEGGDEVGPIVASFLLADSPDGAQPHFEAIEEKAIPERQQQRPFSLALGRGARRWFPQKAHLALPAVHNGFEFRHRNPMLVQESLHHLGQLVGEGRLERGLGSRDVLTRAGTRFIFGQEVAQEHFKAPGAVGLRKAGRDLNDPLQFGLDGLVVHVSPLFWGFYALYRRANPHASWLLWVEYFGREIS